jgi:hypothetical protein
MILVFRPEKMQREKSHSTSPRERVGECSPGRKPGVPVPKDYQSPGRGERDFDVAFLTTVHSVALFEGSLLALSVLTPASRPGLHSVAIFDGSLGRSIQKIRLSKLPDRN